MNSSELGMMSMKYVQNPFLEGKILCAPQGFLCALISCEHAQILEGTLF